ncbi:DUF3734 domain-containing protein [Paraburkholderia sp. CNPSo 3281]|uniref:DUF3734 domain-containing protein n=1 Tax=Paraburkholderia sp. CNPSo 3281 TaxID=2940933 RepID=UPI0035CD1B3B
MIGPYPVRSAGKNTKTQGKKPRVLLLYGQDCADRQKHARFIKELLPHVPAELRRTDPLFRLAEEAADGSAINVVHLIYKSRPYEGHCKDYEFRVDTMQEHWRSGLEDMRDSFSRRDWFDVPSREQVFVTHDVHRRPRSVPESDRDAIALPTALRARFTMEPRGRHRATLSAASH